MKQFFILVAALAVLTQATPSLAQFAKAEDAVKYRQSTLFVVQQHFARLNHMAAGRVAFDPTSARESAEIVAEVSKLPWAAFTAATQQSPSKSKPEVWADPAKFQALAEKSMAETAKLPAAAKLGTVASLRAALGPVATSCKSCHDVFREQ